MKLPKIARLALIASLSIAGLSRISPAQNLRETTDPRIDDIFDAYNQHDFVNVWTQLQPLLNERNPQALYIAGVMTFKGEGVPADHARACEAYRAAAAGGYHAAMNNLGVCLRKGDGVKQDFATATKLFVDATVAGDECAPLNAGVAYVNGEGVRRDYVEGYAYYLLSQDPQAAQNRAELEAKVLAPVDVDHAHRRANEIQKQIEANRNRPVKQSAVGRPNPLDTKQPATKASANSAAAGTYPIKLGLNEKQELVVTQVDPSLFKDLPAGMESCGILVGDKLKTIDDLDVSKLTVEQATQHLSGQVGSNIKLELTRGDSDDDNVSIVSQRK